MSAFLGHSVVFRGNNYWHRIAQKWSGWKWATLVPDALERSKVIRNDGMLAFPGSFSHVQRKCVWIYENGAKELKSRTKRAFTSHQKLMSLLFYNDKLFKNALR